MANKGASKLSIHNPEEQETISLHLTKTSIVAMTKNINSITRVKQTSELLLKEDFYRIPHQMMMIVQ